MESFHPYFPHPAPVTAAGKGNGPTADRIVRILGQSVIIIISITSENNNGLLAVQRLGFIGIFWK